MSSLESDEAEARKVLHRAVAALIALVLAAAVGVGIRRLDAQGGGPVAGIGPAPGADVRGYVDARHQALAREDGTRAAVVSFRAYVGEDRARAVLGGLQPERWLVAAPGEPPATVAVGEAEAWAEERAAAAASEAAELDALASTATDPEFAQQYRSDAVSLRAYSGRLRGGGAEVFGAVVVADAAALRRLVLAPTVRLVDAGAGPAPADPRLLRGLRPEEVERAGNPPRRPLDR